MAVSLQEALEKLRTERIKDRQEGIELINQIFADPLNVSNLDPRGDGKAWLKTFQSLFACVLLDKSACLKKSNVKGPQPVALSRLRESAYAVRQLVERSVQHLNRRVIKAAISHLAQMFVHQNAVFEPIAMSYLKSLSAILHFKPHVDQLEVEEWVMIAELCFNVLLGDDLARPLDQANVSSGNLGLQDSADHRALGLADVEHMVCLYCLISSPTAPLLTEDRYGLALLDRYARFFERYPTEGSSHLPALTGLARLLRELELNESAEVIRFALRTWRTLLSLWSTKNKQLKEQLVICWRILAPVVASCLTPAFDGWTGADMALLEVQTESRLVLVELHRSILQEPDNRWGAHPLDLGALSLTSPLPPQNRRPFATTTTRQSPNFSELDAVSWAILELNATVMAGLLPEAAVQRPTSRVAATQPPGSRETSVLDDIEETLPVTMTSSPSKRQLAAPDQPAPKRRRTGSHMTQSQTGSSIIASLLAELKQPPSLRTAARSSGQSERLWRLQMIVFLVGRWPELDATIRAGLLGVALSLASDSDAAMQSWAFVCLAELVSNIADHDKAGVRESEAQTPTSALVQAWTIACRRLPSAQVTRAAAHLAATLMRCNLIPHATILADLRPILVEIDIQGPAALCDSSVAFVTAALDLASKDSQLFSLNLRSGVLSWLVTMWHPALTASAGQAPQRINELEWPDLFALLSACIGDSFAALLPSIVDRSSTKHTAIQISIEEELKTRSLRAYVLYQRVDELKHQRTKAIGEAQNSLTPESSSNESSPQATTFGAEERRACLLLDRSVAGAIALLENGSEAPNVGEKSFVRTCSSDQARVLLDLALLALAFATLLRHSGVSTAGQLASGAVKLLDATVGLVLRRSDWSPAERYAILRALAATIPSEEEDAGCQGAEEELLVRAGPRSGVQLRESAPARNVYASSATSRPEASFLSAFWQTALSAQGLKPLLDLLHAALMQELNISSREASQSGSAGMGLPKFGIGNGGADDDDDDDFIGNARVAVHDDARAQRDGGASDVYSQKLVSLCVGVLTEAPKLSTNSGKATQDERLVNLMFEGPLESLVKLGPSLVRAVSASSLLMTQRDLSDVLDQVGSDLLVSYQYARDQDARCLAIDLVKASMPNWLSSKKVSADLLEKLRKLCIFFTEQVTKQKWRSPWKVRRRVADFIAAYIRLDPQERFWTDGDTGEMISRCPPSESALHLNCDLDVRVRMAGAKLSAYLFDHFDRDDDGFAALYEKLKDRLPVDHAKPENIATRLLCLANVSIASSSVRRIALFHLLEIWIATNSLATTLKSIFEQIAARLGFHGPQELYECFAGQITWSMSSNSYDPLKVPYKILGFRSRRDCIEQTFRDSGSMLLAASGEAGRAHFATLMRMARKSPKQGIRECLPFLAASNLGFAVEDASCNGGSAKERWEAALDEIKQSHPEAFEADALRDLIASIADQLITVLLGMFYEPSSGSEYPANIRVKDETAYRVMLELSQHGDGGGRGFAVHEPNRPFFRAVTIYDAIIVLREIGIDTSSNEVAYHVLRQMFLSIGKSPFFNDQHRFIEATKLFVATCAETIRESPMLLDVILQGVGFLVDRPQIRASACSLAEWSILACERIAILPYRVASTLTAFAAQGKRDEASNATSPSEKSDPCNAKASGFGRASINLSSWAEGVAAAMTFDSPTLELTLLLWPDAIPAKLRRLAPKGVRPQGIASALQRCPDALITAAVLDRIRASLKVATTDERQDFARSTIWLLFERLKIQDLQRQSVDELARTGQAFAEILNICEGRIRTPGLNALQDLSSSEVRTVLDGLVRLPQPSRTIQAVVVLVIMHHLNGSSIAQSESAYAALKGILSLARTILSALPRWPGHAREELSALTTFHGPDVTAAVRTSRELRDPALVSAAADFDVWIRRLAGIVSHMLIKTSATTFYHHVQTLVEAGSDIALRILPLLMHLFTADDVAEGAEEVTQHLDSGREAISLHFQEVLTSSTADPRAWASIISGFLHVRRWRVLDTDPNYSDLWYHIDFLLLARRSLDCKMYTAALLFVELYFEHATDASATENKQRIISGLLYDIYSNVEDPDGFYGIDNSDVRESLTRRLHHEGEWHRALQLHAAEYETSATAIGTSAPSSHLIGTTFHKLGFNRLASTMYSGVNKGGRLSTSATSTDSGFDYDMAWRTGAWDLPCTSTHQPGTSRATFSVLRALHRDRAAASIDREVDRNFARELRGLASAKPEAINEVKKVQLDLLALNEARSWRQLVSQLGTEEAINHVGAIWAEPRPTFELDCYERMLSVRQSMLQAERMRGQINEIGDMLSTSAEDAMKLERSMMICLSAAARKQGRLQASINATAKAQKLQASLSDQSNRTDEEFASVLWAQGEHSFALDSLSAIIEGIHVEPTSAAQARYRKAVLMARLGEWRATTRSQQPRVIDTTLFMPALELMTGPTTNAQAGEEQAKVAYKWARFADEQYRSVDVEEINRLKVYIERRQEEIRQNQVESDKTSSRTMKHRLMQFQRQAEKILRQDESHLKELETTRTLFLQRAIAMYSRSLTMADRYDDAVGRLTSLWFDNSFDENANLPLAASLSKIPSHKFIPLTHQLSARLSSAKGTTKGATLFQNNLTSLVLRICRDHPFHTLYALYALLKAGKDAKATEAKASRKSEPSSSQGLDLSQRQRSLAAEAIWNKVKTTDRLKQRFHAFEEVCQAYVEWAEVNLTQQYSHYFTPNGAIKKGSLRMPPAGELRISRLRNIDVPVATAEVPIDRSCEYRDIVSIVRYSETFTTAGGIHLPKINECIGSDGRRYKQLFKRDDDLRQDAVMQQVFRLVNGLLDKDRRASQRQLTVRTYAVIPLGPQCGLLEFVTNTVPIGEVLIRMHSQYGPNDMSPMEARTRVREAQGMTASQKLDVFLDVCERMPPAFRFFFTETQKDPPSWFAMRLNYTRSAATTSIVGHILGLGDRHVSNILLDKQSGELVHIDFGVAFDQGKLLPIPELVPFRLTRDLVDGMGLSGIEGTYRRCCEETLRVLRDGRDVVKTVLEVFKHDPLFAWTSNPIKVLKAQGATGEDETGSESVGPNAHAAHAGRNGRQGRSVAPSVEPQAAAAASVMTIDTAELSADRAVTSVMTKLSSSLSVEYTVNELIQQAMDAGNLSAIFQGWQAAL